MARLELGLLVAGDAFAGARTPAERQRAIVDEAVLAESLGFDSVWLGEQPVASVVAAIAARTSRVRLGARVALDVNVDPVRVAEDYATVDAIAGGRIELVGCAGGPDTEESRERLRENVELLRRLWSEPEVTWSGRFRSPLDAVTLEPRPVQRPHPPIWIGASSFPAVDLAAALGLPLLLAGALDMAPLVVRYRSRFAAAGHDPAKTRVGCVQSVHVARTSEEAHGRRDDAAICGSPAEIAERIGAAREALGLDVHLSTFDRAGLPAAQVARARELFAAEVVPRLR